MAEETLFDPPPESVSYCYWPVILHTSSLSLTCKFNYNTITISLTHSNGTEPTPNNPLSIRFPDGAVYITRPTILIVPQGKSLGIVSGVASTIYVYAVRNGESAVLGVSLTKFRGVITTNAIAGGSDPTKLYTAVSTNSHVKMIGIIDVAGVWTAVW
jgi:hypothetical protein